MERIIQEKDIIYAKIVKNFDDTDASIFFTKPNDIIQLSLTVNNKDEKTGAYYNNMPDTSQADKVDEIILVIKGQIRVDFYSEIGSYIKSAILNPNNLLIVYKGGHNIVYLENSKILNFKNGPYKEEQDKTRIIGVNNLELIIDED